MNRDDIILGIILFLFGFAICMTFININGNLHNDNIKLDDKFKIERIETENSKTYMNKIVGINEENSRKKYMIETDELYSINKTYVLKLVPEE